MEASPPYLFGNGDRDGCMSVTCDVETGLIEMTVRGKLSPHLSSTTYTALRKCLAEHPAAIIVDLHQLQDPFAASAAMWLAVNRAATALQPPVQLALNLPPTAPLAGRLRRLGVARFFSIFATMPQARAALAGKVPLTERLQLKLLPERSSAGAARSLVGIACDAWRISELLHPGRAIMSELVANAVEHAGTDISAAVWRRGSGLHLSVRDRNPRLPRLLHPTRTISAGDRGHGLRIVDAKSTAWGAMATHDGKMVWATLRVQP